MVFDGVDCYAFAGKRFYDFDLCTHDLENLISLWPECDNYFCD